MPNFALSHKAGPRRIERNLSFYCGGNNRAARTPTGPPIRAQCYCAEGTPWAPAMGPQDGHALTVTRFAFNAGAMNEPKKAPRIVRGAVVSLIEAGVRPPWSR